MVRTSACKIKLPKTKPNGAAIASQEISLEEILHSLHGVSASLRSVYQWPKMSGFSCRS